MKCPKQGKFLGILQHGFADIENFVLFRCGNFAYRKIFLYFGMQHAKNNGYRKWQPASLFPDLITCPAPFSASYLHKASAFPVPVLS